MGFGQFGETAVFRKGAEVIQTDDTHYGRIGVSTCRDMSFSFYIRQAGEKNVDIMFGPSYDMPRSYGPCYTLRAIEYGFSFVRPTYNGFTFAEDFNGNILAEMQFDAAVDCILYCDVPTKGRKTVYSAIGDTFAWICVVAMFLLMGIRLRKKSKQQTHAQLHLETI